MEKYAKYHIVDLNDSELQGALSEVLRVRIETYRGNYKENNREFPNAAISSKEAREVLLFVELLRSATLSGYLERDTLLKGDSQLKVYNADELPEEKRLSIEKMFSDNPGTLYMGRVKITPEYYSLFIESTRTAFVIFAVLCIGGVFASLVRGNVR